MGSCLILVTGMYPFSVDEAFLESEAPFLSKQFEKVIVLAISPEKNTPLTRQVPDNFDCYNVTSTSKKLHRAVSLLKGIFASLNPSANVEDEAKQSFKHRLFYEYFAARGEREFALCEDIINKYDFSQYDSVTVYSYWFFVAALVAGKIYDKILPQCKKIKLVSRAHGHDVYREAQPVNYIPKRRFLLEKFDMLYPCSINGEKYIAESYPEYSHKISHRYLGTLDDGKTQMNDDCFHIVSCSRMIPLKRVDRIASALSLLEKENLGKIRWTHIGDGGTFETVRNICDSKLSFMKTDLLGRVPNEKVKEFYRTEKIDLFVNVSTTEGLPVSMMEAMSYSIPVIATDVGGVGEIVKDGYNGMLIPADFSDEEFAEKIKEIILSSKSEREIMRNNSRTFWEDNFDAEKNYTHFAAEICG